MKTIFHRIKPQIGDIIMGTQNSTHRVWLVTDIIEDGYSWVCLSNLVYRGIDYSDYNKLIEGYVVYRNGVKLWTA